MTYIEAAVKVLRENDNKPMSSNEIWDQIDKYGLVKTHGKTPAASLSTVLLSSSDNSNVKDKFKKTLLTIVEKSPIKFIIKDQYKQIYLPLNIKIIKTRSYE